MARLMDLTGKRFHKLTVLRRSDRTRRNTVLWDARCDCGREVSVAGNNLRSSNSQSCGCLKHQQAHNVVDRTGRKYGLLTVLGRVENSDKRRTTWLCRCQCGVEKVMSAQYLKESAGGIKSCGCLRHVPRRGKQAPGYKRGYYQTRDGYICLRGEDRNGKWGERPQHVIVMEDHLGRKLEPDETVHHKNGIRSDNHIQNLELWSSKHPSGQRTEDMVNFCLEYLAEYAPERLRGAVA